jgi:hypothetical protein
MRQRLHSPPEANAPPARGLRRRARRLSLFPSPRSHDPPPAWGKGRVGAMERRGGARVLALHPWRTLLRSAGAGGSGPLAVDRAHRTIKGQGPAPPRRSTRRRSGMGHEPMRRAAPYASARHRRRPSASGREQDKAGFAGGDKFFYRMGEGDWRAKIRTLPS